MAATEVKLDWVGLRDGDPVFKAISTIGKESLTRTGTPTELDEKLFIEGLGYRGLQVVETLALIGIVKFVKDLFRSDISYPGKIARIATLAAVTPMILSVHAYTGNRLSRVEAVRQKLTRWLSDE